jgi:glycosyltransferase involved in cell wall biosynthesis
MSDPLAVFVAVIAPNVSEQMGGEAIKALQYFEELRRRRIPSCVITHARVRSELQSRRPDWPVYYVEDTPLQVFLWKSRVFRYFLDVVFHLQVRSILRDLQARHDRVIAHYLTPVSPAQPALAPVGTIAVIGPKNGNIHFPPAFRGQELLPYKLRRLLRPVAHRFVHLLFNRRLGAAVVLVAGGERTRESLRLAGYREEQFLDVLDSGIDDRLGVSSRFRQEGRNSRFVHFGRLVRHKGVHLVLEALARANESIELDLFGQGPEEERLHALAERLGITQRVRFLGWAPDHHELLASLGRYRGFVFPSLAEANGIVVQESMAIGLPVIALNWGGPALLLDGDTGILVEPTSEAVVVEQLASAMTRLAADGALADRLAAAAREVAVGKFLWSKVADQWLSAYPVKAEPVGNSRRA